MEAIAAVASIMGIISLTLQTIDKIQLLFKGYGGETAEMFSQKLDEAVCLLSDVDILMRQVEKVKLDSSSILSASALIIHLEDYKSGLEECLSRGQSIMLREDKPHHSLFAKALGRVARLERWLKYNPNGNKKRKDVLAMMEYHTEKIRRLLDVLQRHTSLQSLVKLESVGEHLVHIDRMVTEESNNIADILESLPHSESLSGFRSAGQRLPDADSDLSSLKSDMASMVSELKGLKEAFLDSLSSGTSSQGFSFSHRDSSESSNNTESEHAKSYHIETVSKKRDIDPPLLNDPVRKLQGDLSSHTSKSDDHYEPEFSSLFRVTHLIIDNIRTAYSPPASEYIATLSAWKLSVAIEQAIWQSREDLNPLKQSGSTNPLSRLTRKSDQLFHRLSIIRRRCHHEDLHSTLKTIDAAFGIDEDMAKNYFSEADEQEYLKLDLSMLDQRSTEAKDSRLLKINSWLYGVVQAYPEYIKLHRSIFLYILAQEKRGESDVSTITSASMESEADWSRLMLQNWLLDGTITDSFDLDCLSEVPETEATEIPFQHDEDDDGELIPDSDEGIPQLPTANMAFQARKPDDDFMKLLKTVGPKFVEHLPPNGDYYFYARQPSSVVTNERRARADAALEKYQNDLREENRISRDLKTLFESPWEKMMNIPVSRENQVRQILEKYERKGMQRGQIE